MGRWQRRSSTLAGSAGPWLSLTTHNRSSLCGHDDPLRSQAVEYSYTQNNAKRKACCIWCNLLSLDVRMLPNILIKRPTGICFLDQRNALIIMRTRRHPSICSKWKLAGVDALLFGQRMLNLKCFAFAAVYYCDVPSANNMRNKYCGDC